MKILKSLQWSSLESRELALINKEKPARVPQLITRVHSLYVRITLVFPGKIILI
jgi:hypothetical protein